MPWQRAQKKLFKKVLKVAITKNSSPSSREISLRTMMCARTIGLDTSLADLSGRTWIGMFRKHFN